MKLVKVVKRIEEGKHAFKTHSKEKKSPLCTPTLLDLKYGAPQELFQKCCTLYCTQATENRHYVAITSTDMGHFGHCKLL